MKTKVLAIALATVAVTIASDAASARDVVRMSESGQVAVQRNRRVVHRYQVPGVVPVDNALAAAAVYGWTAPYVGVVGGYDYSTDW